MKTRHAVPLALHAFGLALLCFGMAGAGFLLMASGTLTTLVVDALIGKQNNL